MKTKILFICVHNSARSQMAAAFLNHFCPDDFIAESAGLEPGELNPLVVEAMAELGIDISMKIPQSVFELFRSGKLYSHVISVCDAANAERCPVFPGYCERHEWSFPDPSVLQGSHAERMEGVRKIRAQIEARVREWCADRCRSNAPAPA